MRTIRGIIGRRTRTAVFAAAVCAALLLSGCGGEGMRGSQQTEESGGAPDGIKIGISFDSFVIERWLRDRDVFVSTAGRLGAEVNVQNANGEVKEQISQIEYLIDKKMDVIVIVAIDGDALGDVVRRARQAGIRVVCYDRLIRNASADLYVSFDNVMVGTLMGNSLRESLPEGGKIFRIQGSESDNNVGLVREGFDAALEGSGIEIVYSTFCANWLAELAFDAVNEGLTLTGGKVDGIMCGNDDLAGQAIKALTEHKLAGEIPVVAQDAELSACQRIVEGTQTMTVYKSVDEEARIAAELSVALARGEDITDPSGEIYAPETISDGTSDVPYYPLEPVPVTRDNMDEVIVDGGFHQREDVYLNIGGEGTDRTDSGNAVGTDVGDEDRPGGGSAVGTDEENDDRTENLT